MKATKHYEAKTTALLNGLSVQIKKIFTVILGVSLMSFHAFKADAVTTPEQTSPDESSSSKKIVLVSQDGQVEVNLNPFRMTISAPSGRVVLQEVPNALPNPGPAQDAYVALDQASSNPVNSTPPIYSPVTYTVGTANINARPSSANQGNLNTASLSGTTYAVTNVISFNQTPTSLSLVLGTNEPNNRHLMLDITPEAGGFRFQVKPDRSDNIVSIDDSFGSKQSEAFRGFGGLHNALNQRGQTITTYTQEENVDAIVAPLFTGIYFGTGDETQLFPNGATAAYYPQAQFVSSNGYGLLLKQTELSRFRLNSDQNNAWRMSVYSNHLEYNIAIGSQSKVIRSLTSITGRHLQPPEWALGLTLDRQTPFSSISGLLEYLIRSDIEQIKRTKLPVRAYRIEQWETLSKDVLAELIQEFHNLGIHVVVYFNDLVDSNSKYYSEVISNNLVPTRSQGEPYIITTVFLSSVVILDYTNPATRDFWNRRITAALDAGADGFMEDFGEQVLPDMVFADGSTGLTMHNRYPVVYHQATRAILDQYQQAHPGRELFSYVRSGYSGSAGFEAGNFPGDETADFSRSSGLASLTTDMLNRGIGGAYGFTTDIGGYLNYPNTADKELYLRWTAWSALTPFFRVHNSGLSGTVMPYDFDNDTLDRFAKLAALHQQAIPLIKRLWQEARTTGMPITRPLWLVYPHDPQAAAQDQEWLLGSDVLVAPVVSQGKTSREVYIPVGCWQEQNTAVNYNGPKTIMVDAPVGTLPYFFRCGTNPFTGG